MSGNAQVIKSLLEAVGKHWQSQGSSSFLSKMKNRYKVDDVGSYTRLALWYGKSDMSLGDGAAGSINHQPLGGEILVMSGNEGYHVIVAPGGHSPREDMTFSNLEELRDYLEDIRENLYFVEEGRNYSERDWKGS